MAQRSSSPQPGQKQVWRLLNRDGTFNIQRPRLGGFHWTDLYHPLLSMTWPRFLCILLSSYFTLNVLFALAYYSLGLESLDGHNAVTKWDGFLTCFFFSVQTFATIGYGRIAPASLAANSLVVVEAFVGLLMMALYTGLLFARFSRPTAKVIFSNVAIIASHEGVPSFIFRMANTRFNQIVEAQVSVVLLQSEVTAEGETYRTFYDLKLERNRSPIFALTWTVVHPIDNDSPLYGKTREALLDLDAEILVSLTGIDDTFSQTIHTRFSYTPAEIVFNKTFKDMLSRPAGVLSIDLKSIHEVQDLNA